MKRTILAAAACLAATACSSAFSARGGEAEGGPDDDGGDGSIVVVSRDGAAGDATAGRDAGTDAGDQDATMTDAQGDGGGRERRAAGDAGETGDVVDGGGGEDAAEAGGCGAGFLACDGGCVAEGLENCGTCGHDCADLPHVSGPVTCTGTGQCSFPESSCATGWIHCTSDPDDGCETSSTESPNCGGCGVVCSGGTPVCDGTGCVSGCLKSKPTLCDGGACVDTVDDPQNCDGCGIVCPAGPANSTPTCASSTCGYKCNAGFSGCSGACVDEQSDPDHCGSCTTVCPAGPPSSTPDCVDKVCGWTCDPGTIECGGDSCLSQVPDSTAGVFVSSGGPSSSCGDVAAPCGSITAALTVVAQSGGAKTIVYVAESTTPYVEQVTLPAGVTIQGGWVYSGAGSWSRPCALDATQVVIAAPAGDDRTVIAAFDGTSTLDTLTVENENTATAGTATTPGQTLYGIFAANAASGQTNLVLTNVGVNVAAGGAGGTGAQGGAGAAAPGSCSAGTGASGTTGALGPGAGTGTYDVDGYHPATGGVGVTGNPGGNGTAAPKPECVTGSSACCTGADGCASCSGKPPKECATAGTNGCASGVSAGGAGGTGGGASLGIYAWNTTVQVSGSVATVAQGGAGGNGGPGGVVLSGTQGAKGSPSSPVPASCKTECQGMVCRCDSSLETAPAGKAGGQGGSGGSGGGGGGGSGGDGFCFYAGGTSTPPSSGLSCTTGSAAPGGNAGQGDEGASGRVGTTN